jgi:hypothetical protein
MKLQWLGFLLLVMVLAACSTSTPEVNADLDSLAYVPLGGALDSSLVEDAINTSIVVDGTNKPYVAWQESDPIFAYNNNVRYWNGSSWLSLGSTDRDFENSAGQPSLAFNKAINRVYVAWNEYDYFDAFGNDPLTRHNIYVSFWNGGSWTPLGGALDRQIGRNTASPSLALSASGTPYVAWNECFSASVPWDNCLNYNIYVKRWTGSSWVNVGNALDKVVTNNATEPSLAIGSDGLPVVAWQEGSGVATDIVVKKWNGSIWTTLSSALDVNLGEQALTPSLVIDKLNRPVVAWQESDPVNAYNLFVKRFSGSWVQLGTVVDRTLSDSTGSPSVVINTAGNPVVSFTEFVSPNFHNIYVRRWVPSTGTWANVGGALDNIVTHNAIWSSLALTSLNKPIVAWQECDWPCTSNNNVYVKQLQ